MGALQQQVVMITGCSSGIGRAVALELAALGHTVVATARQPESLGELRQHRGITTLTLDVRDRASIGHAVSEVLAKHGVIDVLINNAGFNLVGPLVELDLADVESILSTNVVGALAVVQAVAPHMMRAGHGRIVNLGSMVGVVGTPFAGAYCASKAALHMLSFVLRLELHPFGVDVISLEPGRVRSQISQNARIDLKRYEATSSWYHSFADGIRRRWGASQVDPTDTAVFARKVVRQIIRQRAPRVVRAGRGSVLLPWLYRLAPPRFLDWALRRAFGLSSTAQGPVDPVSQHEV